MGQTHSPPVPSHSYELLWGPQYLKSHLQLPRPSLFFTAAGSYWYRMAHHTSSLPLPVAAAAAACMHTMDPRTEVPLLSS